MKLHHWLLLAWSLLLGAFAPGVSAQTAELEQFHRVVVRPTETGMQLLDLAPDNTLTLVTELEGVALYFLPGAFKWYIQAAIDIAPSPDGQRVAFTALGSEDETKLFIISLNPLHISQYSAPGIASLQWSPTGDALLHSFPHMLLSSEIPSLSDGDAYVFDLAAETFTLVAETNDAKLVSYSKWLPDGQNIVYVTRDRFITPGELVIPDLFVVNRDGITRRQLTDLKRQAPQSIDFTQPSDRYACEITQFKWSRNGRLYYFLNCWAFNEANLPSLFSVDLAGNNRLETDLVSLFLDEVDFVRGFGVVDFFPDTADGQMYLVVNTPTQEMRVLRLNASGELEVLARVANKDGYAAALSADGSRIAISTTKDVLYGGNPLIALYNLTTGQMETKPLPLAEREACRVQWQNKNIVLVDQVMQCVSGTRSFGEPVSIFAWDTARNTLEDIQPRLGGALSLVIPLPEYAAGE